MEKASGNCVFSWDSFHQELVFRHFYNKSFDPEIFQEKKEEALEMANFPDSSAPSLVKQLSLNVHEILENVFLLILYNQE